MDATNRVDPTVAAVTGVISAVLEGKLEPGELLSSGPTPEPTPELALAELLRLRVVTQTEEGPAALGPGRWRPGVLAHLPEGSVGTFPPAATLAHDAVDLIRFFYRIMVRTAVRRLGARDLDDARDHLERAFEARSDAARFTSHNLAMLRAVLEPAKLFPLLWVLNEIDHMRPDELSPAPVFVPDGYVPLHRAMFDAIERGDSEEAMAVAMDFVDQLETVMLSAIRRVEGTA